MLHPIELSFFPVSKALPASRDSKATATSIQSILEAKVKISEKNIHSTYYEHWCIKKSEREEKRVGEKEKQRRRGNRGEGEAEGKRNRGIRETEGKGRLRGRGR